jgi:murein DD-endopeptidase MepM/ murein hydrolase activator NlpD
MSAVATLAGFLTALLAALSTTVVGGATGTAGGGEGGTPKSGEWPLDPRPAVVRGFDPPKTAWGSGHRGVDLLGRPGQPVRAAKAGRIIFAGRLAGRGVVVVDHGAVRSTYEPVAAVVKVGQHVAGGQQIGSLQAGGSHCFPRACLHWGLLRGDTYLDPLGLVGGGPVRLFPLSGAPPVAAGPSSDGSHFAGPGAGAGPGIRAVARAGDYARV